MSYRAVSNSISDLSFLLYFYSIVAWLRVSLGKIKFYRKTRIRNKYANVINNNRIYLYLCRIFLFFVTVIYS